MESASGIARRLLCGALLALCAATALPQTPSLYTVEILVFRNGANTGALPDTFVPPEVTDDGIEATPVATGKLNAAAAKLRSKGGLAILAHTAWTQGPAARNSHQGVSAAQLNLANGLTGKFILDRDDRALHLGVDLILEEGGHRYRINQTRTVKSNQIYYFDHPAIGVLAIVSAAPGG